MKSIANELLKNLITDDPEVEARLQHGPELYRKGTLTLKLQDAEGREIPDAEIEFKQIRHEFEFGCNGFMIHQFDDPEKQSAHDEYFSRLFNLAVVHFYWSDTEPVDGAPRFDRDSPPCYRRPNTDEALEFCDRHHLAAKGHPLMWHSFIPAWLKGSERELRVRWERRVREIAARYGERIHNWDVVNEAVEFNPANPQLPRNHVEFAFDIARKYLPEGVTLNYNDYACWRDLHGNYTPIVMLVRSLLQQGRKVDCLGLQYHQFGFQPENIVNTLQPNMLNARNLFDSLDTYATLGIPTNISEVTITAHEVMGSERLDYQAEAAEQLYRIWFSHPSTTGIIYWNLVDDTAYVNPIAPQWNENIYKGGLLANGATLTPKPVYERLHHLIKEEWQSSGNVVYKAGIPCYFRGFHGTYRAKIKTNFGVFEREFLIERNRRNYLTATL